MNWRPILLFCIFLERVHLKVEVIFFLQKINVKLLYFFKIKSVSFNNKFNNL